MKNLTIVMYHYVRQIKDSKYQKIKGLEVDGFKRQLDYLCRDFNLVTAEDVISSVKGSGSLPAKACWLTFDDGYKDHYINVFPELMKRGIQGSFFAPVRPVTERIMLDVNSIHFILACTDDINKLIGDLNVKCQENGLMTEQLEHLWNTYAVESRYDCKEIIYVKRMLQHALPEQLRNRITTLLFEQYVGINQTDFAETLYLSSSEIKCLVDAGMYVGSHGYRHLWMNKEDRCSQKEEILSSIEFLRSIGSNTEEWIMCYPYGGYNDVTIELLEEMDCAVGITTETDTANLTVHHALKLPRLDTNDFPS